MARYYFDIEDGQSYPDPEGAIFYDLEAVRAEALRRTVDLLASRGDEFWRGHGWKMVVTDERRTILFVLNFMAVNAPSTASYGKKPSEE